MTEPRDPHQTARARLSLARLRELLDAYGADAARWPENERAAARELCASDAQAQALLTQAQALDALLDQAPSYEPSPVLAARVAEIPLRTTRASDLRWTPRRVWGAAFAAVTVCALGVLSGALLDFGEDTQAATADATSTEAVDDDAWDDLAQLALAENFGREP
jgi:hypothetical protein